MSAVAGQLLARAAFAVIDVDVTGTDLRHDSLLGVAVCPVRGAAVRPEGLRHFDLRGGADPAAELLDALAGHVPVGHHLPFAVHVIERRLKPAGAALRHQPGLDLADALPALLPERAPRHAPLATWLESMHIRVFREHDARADAWCMAQALLVVLELAQARGARSVADLFELAGQPPVIGM